MALFFLAWCEPQLYMVCVYGVFTDDVSCTGYKVQLYVTLFTHAVRVHKCLW